MSEKFKDMRVILSILLAMTVAGSALGFYFVNSNHKKQVAQKDNEIVALQSELGRIGEMTTVYNIRADVHSGKKVEETDLQPVELPASIATNMISDPTQIVGSTYKIDISANTIVTSDMLSTVELTNDMRYLDVVTHFNPLGIEPDSYVDIRISMPMGEDYIAMSHKKVEQINTGILKLIVTEEDIMTYNSMLIDALIYPGTQIYAVEYVEGGVQESAETFYPMSKRAIAIAQKNPNLMTAIREDILARRDILETSGKDVIVRDDDLQRTLDTGREQVLSAMSDATREIDKQREERAKVEADLEEQRQQEETARKQQEANALANAQAGSN